MTKKLFLVAFLFFITKVFATDYYVTLSGSNSNNGLTEANAWRTIDYAAGRLQPGDKVWIKAGDYGNEFVQINTNGTPSSRISFIGYKNTIGDITSMYYTYAKGKPLDSSEMPMLDGGNGGKNVGFTVKGDYVTVQNIQITNYMNLMYVTGGPKGVIIDNILTHTAGKTAGQPGAQGIGILFNSDGGRNNIVRNSVAVNCSVANMRIYGSNNLIENCKSYADRNDNGNGEATDYYIVVRGMNNIIRNCYVERVGDLSHVGHGISLKASLIPTENNLIENCTIKNVKGAIEFRHKEVKNNLAKNITFLNGEGGLGGGIVFRDGANYNIAEGCTMIGLGEGMRFYDSSSEDGGVQVAGHHNKMINCVFDGCETNIATVNGLPSTNNEFINCTFNNSGSMFYTSTDFGNTNLITNSSISNIAKEKANSGNLNAVYRYNNYWNFWDSNGSKPTGLGNISVNPDYVNAATGNFRLKETSKLKDVGQSLPEVDDDYDGIARPQGPGYDIGAFEYINTFTGSAGPDISICNGENAVLTASGGTSYSWNTGETTASITVNPTTTTTYSVTISNGSDTLTDDIIVTVDEVPSVSLGSDETICFGESITLTATGVGNFLWSTGETTESIEVSPTVTTTYTVTASSSCSSDATDQISVNVTPEIILDAGADLTICTGESTTLTATGNGGFLWNTGETTASITVNPVATTTYTVTSSIGNCLLADDIIVTVDVAPSVTLGNDENICYGEEITLTATGVGNFLWSTGETTASISVTPLATTTYTVTASNSCSTEVTDDIIINVNPEIILDGGSDVIICSGESTTLTATGNGSFLWNTGETTASISVNPASTTTYTVSSTSGSCTFSDDVLVTVNNVPSVDLGIDQTICYGESITLTATGEGDFLWNTGETTSSITVSPISTTTYSVTASNSCNTDVTDDIVITVNPEITLDAGSDISICSGESSTLTAIGNGSFLWSTGETTASITVNPTETTTYTVTSTIGPCSVSDEVLVNVGEPASVSLGNDETICFGDQVILTATGQGSFLWSNGETGSSISVSPSSTTTYSVTATGTCSTPATDQIIVNVVPEITLNAGADTTICSGENITLTATGNGTFLWDTGETTASITVSPSSTTIYTVTSSSGNCSMSDVVRVTVDQAPSVSLGNDKTICFGEEVTLMASGTGNFLWSTGETARTISVSPDDTTTYTVIATSSCGGEETDEIIVNVTPEIVVDAGANMTICSGESITLTATGNGSFLWSTGETTASITVNPSRTTTYEVTSELGNCTETDSVEITVNDAPSLNLGEDVSICEGESTTLTATGNGSFLWSTGETTASISVNPTVTTSYTVSSTSSCGTISDEIVVTVNSEITLNAGPDRTICSGESVTLTAAGNGSYIWSTGETTASITVNPTSSTTYTVNATSGNCSVSDSVLVNVNETPAVSLGDDITICQGESVTLTATGQGNFLWNTGQTTASISVSPETTSTYSVTLSDSCGETTDEIIVNVNSVVNLTVSDDMIICSGESVTLTATGNGDFLWSTGETSSSITVNPEATSTYSVSLTNSCGGNMTENIQVTVNELPIVYAGDDITIESGTSTILTAQGEGTFLWNTGETTASITVSPINTTTYTVTATSESSCSSSDTVIVTVEIPADDDPVDDDPHGFIYAGQDVELCGQGASVTLTATGGDVYLWDTGEYTASITVSPTETTTYSVTGSAGDEIGSDEVTVYVDEACLGATNRPSEENMLIYPNPTKDILNIELTGFSDEINISLYNLNGSKVFTESIQNTSRNKVLKHRLNLSKLGRGVYFVRLINLGEVYTKKIMVI